MGRVLVNERRLLDIIDQMRVAVPEDVKKAHQLLQERDDIINQAVAEAKRISGTVESELSAKLQESSITKAAEESSRQIISEAEQKAEGIVAEAKRQASHTTAEADRYALEVLRKLDAQLVSFLGTIRKGIETLEKEASKGKDTR